MKRPSFQFYPADWRKDSALQSCSLAAQGLWINLMCIAHETTPYGFLLESNSSQEITMIRRLVGGTSKEIRKLLAELEQAKVFSRDERGVIYSRRMVKDEHIRTVRGRAGLAGWQAKGGKRSGNGKFDQANEQANDQANDDTSGDLLEQDLEQTDNLLEQNGKQKTASSSSSSIYPPIVPLPGGAPDAIPDGNGNGKTKRRKRLPSTPCPQSFEVTPLMHDVAVGLGVPADRVMAETEAFIDHHRAHGSLFANWHAAWLSWIRRVEKFERR